VAPRHGQGPRGASLRWAAGGLALAAVLSVAVWRSAHRPPPVTAGAVHVFQAKPGAVQPYIADWMVTGPFPWGANRTNDELLAVLDRGFFPAEPQVVKGEADLARAVRDKKTETIKVHVKNGEVALHTLFSESEYQAAFAVAQIESAADTGDAALLIESDDAVRVWLNGQPVHTSATVRRLQQFEDYTPVRLRKGLNRIVLKLVRGAKRGGNWNSWSFAAGVRSLQGAREEKAARGFLQELTTSLVGRDGRLGVDLRLFEGGRGVTVDIQDHRRALVRRLQLAGGERHAVDIGDLPTGVYYFLVPDSAAPEPFPFYKGDVALGHRELLAQAAPLLANPALQANVSAIEERFAHLLKPQHRENQNHLWQAKIAMLFAEWHSILDATRDGRDPFRDVPGTHLRGIRSRVDGSNQYYILHVPRRYQPEDGPLPLVIIMPYIFETLRPFLESIPVAEIGILGTIARIADENGLAFLWMDNRGNTYGSDFGERDMFDALAQVSRDYVIDPERLYLFGSCVGGREALTLAAKYPDRFAAVGTMSPVATFQTYPPARPTDPHGDSAYSQKSPLRRLENLVNVPIYALHGDQNTHTPLEESFALQAAARKAGVPFELDIVPGATHLRFPVEPRAVIFRWFASHRREPNPDHVVLTTSAMRYDRASWVEIERFADAGAEARIEAWYRDGEVRVVTRNVGAYRLSTTPLLEKSSSLTVRTNGATSFAGQLGGRSEIRVAVTPEPPARVGLRKRPALGGPLWDAFTGPFLVVAGTAGGTERARANRALADQLVASWRERYRGAIPIKTDEEVTAADLHDNHLLLFGDIAAKGALARLPAKLPFHRRGDRLEGPGRARYDGDVSVQYVFPNPANPDRYLVVAGTPSRPQLPADAIQLTLKGWYDYAVWRWSPSGEPTLEDAGLFDSSWSQLISRVHGNSPLSAAHRGRTPRTTSSGAATR
jgi:predicted esterase